MNEITLMFTQMMTDDLANFLYVLANMHIRRKQN